MMRIERAVEGHFHSICPQQNQALAQIGPETKDYIDVLLTSPECYAILDSGERVVALFGSVEQTPGIASAWSVLSEGIGREGLLFTTRAVRRKADALLEDHKGFRRVEFTVESDYAAGIAWARTLGFRAEGVLNKFGPGGKDHIIYARWSGM